MVKKCSNGLGQCKSTSNRQADQKSSKVHSTIFFNFINIIIAKYYLSQQLSAQSLYTSMAVFFCDITKSSENVMVDLLQIMQLSLVRFVSSRSLQRTSREVFLISGRSKKIIPISCWLFVMPNNINLFRFTCIKKTSTEH